MLGERAARGEHVGVRRGGIAGDHGGEGRTVEDVVVQCEPCTEVGDRLTHEARLVLRLGEVLPDTCVPRLEGGGTLERDDRSGLLTGVQQRRAQPEVDQEAARAERVRAPEALEGVGEPSPSHQLGAELELALGVSRHR